MIEAFGSTSLVEVGNNYYLDSNSTGSGPEVIFGSGPVVAGQFAGWSPVGAEQTSSGYEVAMKETGISEFIIWSVDGSGNYITNVAPMSGSSATLEAYETSFHQDLNGDGVIGVPVSPGTAIESFGSTSLTLVGNNYYLDSNSTGSGPEVIFGSGPLTAGEFVWTPIGAEQTSTGYEIALKDTANGQYTIWLTDSSGNYITTRRQPMSGSSATLEAYETSFHQDLNGDGVIGVPAPTGTAIESFGSTKLVQVGNDYYLDSNSTGSGPEVILNGSGPVVAGEFAGWSPIGAEQTSSGYEIALKETGVSQFTIWSVPTAAVTTSRPEWQPVRQQCGAGSLRNEFSSGSERRRRDRCSCRCSDTRNG